MALFVPCLLHTLQQAAHHAGPEPEPCWHKGDGLRAKSGISFHRIFPQGVVGVFLFVFFKFFSKGNRIKTIKPQSFQEHCLNRANTLKHHFSPVRGSGWLWGWQPGVPGHSEAAWGGPGRWSRNGRLSVQPPQPGRATASKSQRAVVHPQPQLRRFAETS